MSKCKNVPENCDEVKISTSLFKFCVKVENISTQIVLFVPKKGWKSCGWTCWAAEWIHSVEWRLAETLGRAAGAEWRLSPVTHTSRGAHTKQTYQIATSYRRQQGCNCSSCDRRGRREEGLLGSGRGGEPGGVVRNSVRRPNTMFQPQMGHISSPQSTNLLLPSLHTLNVWRGKEGGRGGCTRDGEMSSAAPKNAYFNCPSQLIITNDWGSFFHWVEVESRNKSRGGEMKREAPRWLQTCREKTKTKKQNTFVPRPKGHLTHNSGVVWSRPTVSERQDNWRDKKGLNSQSASNHTHSGLHWQNTQEQKWQCTWVR